MGMILVGLSSVLLLQVLGSPEIVGGDYAWFKGLFALLLTVVLQPTMVFAAVKHAKSQVEKDADASAP